MKKISELTGTESAYWLNVANNYSGKYWVIFIKCFSHC